MLRAFLVMFVMTAPASAQVFDYESLPGWAEDDHLAALKTFRTTCDLITDADWTPVCRVAADVDDNESAARQFF